MNISPRNSVLDDDGLLAGGSLESVTETVIKPIVRKNLRATLDADDTCQRNLDALELISEIQIIVLTRLASESSNNNGNGIRHMAAFAGAVASNACYQYFRTKYPARTAQKNRLRYIFTHQRGLALWQDDEDRLLCGLQEWKYENKPAADLSSIKPRKATISGSIVADHLKLVNGLFEHTCGPVFLDDLVEYSMEAFGIRERVDLAMDQRRTGERRAELVRDEHPGADRVTEGKDRLMRLWKAIKDMPLKQRAALLLNLKDRQGESLITTFPLSGTASVREIAELLEFEPEDFAAVWATLPWDDLTIAEHLGMTRQQVINLRQAARVRLSRVEGK